MGIGLPQPRHDSLTLGKEICVKKVALFQENLPLFAVGHFVDNRRHNYRKPRQQGLSSRCLKNSQRKHFIHFKSILLPMSGKTVLANMNIF
jgi:hypothetical protein